MFVSGCSGAGLSAQDIGSIVSQSCVDINLQLCPQQDGLRQCCATYLACPSGQVCTDVSDQFGAGTGFCTTAALKVMGDVIWPIVDLRVDWAEVDPIGQLDALWHAYRPQMQDYLTRALNPTAAPSYGVPGDE